MNSIVVNRQLSIKTSLLLILGAAASFHLAYSFPRLGFLIFVYLCCLFELSQLRSARVAFYAGLTVGILAYAPQLAFFWTIFGAAAIVLWLILAFWIGLFVSLARLCRLRFNPFIAAALIPFLWTGLEYFRSELYYLRFSWLNVGYVFSGIAQPMPLHLLGVYGIAFFLAFYLSIFTLLPRKNRITNFAALLATLAILVNWPRDDVRPTANSSGNLNVAGMQLEFPSESTVLSGLNQLVKKHPEAQLLVLCEYTFTGPVPESVKTWCREHHRYLIVGAEDVVSKSQYYDTAYVIGPTGDIIFQQAKCVPIQFFADGLPAREQRLWASPWGKIGICICYDLSYRRVTDELVRQGAQAFVIPTMDVADWGIHQHRLHARVAPVRATEYGIPIFWLASSGISQCIDSSGNVIASAPFPGEGAILAGSLDLHQPGRRPLDYILAPLAVAITGFTIVWLIVCSLTSGRISTPPPNALAGLLTRHSDTLSPQRGEGRGEGWAGQCRVDRGQCADAPFTSSRKRNPSATGQKSAIIPLQSSTRQL